MFISLKNKTNCVAKFIKQIHNVIIFWLKIKNQNKDWAYLKVKN